MPLDDLVVSERLSRLERCARKLSEISRVPLDRFLQDEDLQDKAERNFQVAAQCCIDIGSHIIAAQGLGMPESYADVFETLGNSGVLTTDFAHTFQRIAGFRNILVHDYVKVRPETVYKNLSNISDFSTFARQILEYIERDTR